MPTFYLDSSAILKRYVEEAGSEWVRVIAGLHAYNILHLSQITRVEVASGFARRCREGSLTADERDELLTAFHFDCTNQYRMTEVTHPIFDLAIELTKRHPLRAYDAIQLASAIFVNQALIRHNLPSLIFVSADDRLCTAASVENLAIDNPNLHP